MFIFGETIKTANGTIRETQNFLEFLGNSISDLVDFMEANGLEKEDLNPQKYIVVK